MAPREIETRTGARPPSRRSSSLNGRSSVTTGRQGRSEPSMRFSTTTAMAREPWRRRGVESSGPGDGRLASLVLLGEEAFSDVQTEEMRQLVERRGGIERRIDELRLQRESLDEEVYLSELQDLMVDLALVDRELQAAGDGGGDDAEGNPDR